MQSRKFTISFLKHIGITFCDVRDVTFDELLLEFRRTSKREFKGKINKENFALGLEGIVCGNLTGGKRAADHLTCRSIITYDIDNYNDNLDILEKYISDSLSKHTYIYYTTTSSTFDKPKMRVLLFLNEIIPPQNYAKLSKDTAIQLIPGITLDEASYVAMQVMYMPCRIDGFRSDKNIGELIDTSNYQLVAEPEPKGKVKKTRVKKVKETTCDEVSSVRDELSQSEREGTNCPPPLDEIEEQEDIDDFMEASQEVLNIVSDEKVDETLAKYNCTTANYQEWLRVGQGLHHNYNGGEEGLKKFIEWSLTDTKISEKGRYKNDTVENVCSYKYKTFKLDRKKIVSFSSTIQTVNINRKIPAKFTSINMLEEVPRRKFIDLKNPYELEDIKLKPKSTYENFVIMCDYYNIKIAYDIITKQIINSFNEKNGNDLHSIIISLINRNNMDKSVARGYINKFANDNKINTFREVMNNVIWDGKSRLKEFYSTLTVLSEYETTRDLYLLKWIQQMLYLGLYEGHRKIARNILVLQGEQHIGKSTWIKGLLPENLSDFIGEGLSLNTNDSMSVLTCIRHLIVELGELGQSFKKTDINAFKAFFGKTEDKVNIKYLPEPITYQRTTSFIGTINDDVFLTDQTGSTRMLVLPVLKSNGFHKVDMLQLYKEVLETTDWINFELNEDERECQRKSNERFEYPDYLEEDFVQAFYTEFETGGEFRRANSILSQLGRNIDIKNNSQRLAISKILKKYGFEQRLWDKAYKVKLRNNKNSL